MTADPLNRRVLFRNAAANLASGAAAAVLAVVLPPFLVRLLDRDTYSVWALLLQIGGYTGLLNFGLQTAVGRFVAHAEARKDSDQRDRIVSTAVALLSVSALVGLLAMIGLAVLLQRFFPSIPGSILAETRVALLWVGGSMTLGLPFTVFSGVFTGLQRNEVPASIIVVGRLTTAMGLVLAAASGHGLVPMAIVFASINLTTYGIQWMALRRFAPALRISIQKVNRESFRELVDYCTSLTIWGLAMLMVSGLDLTLVARFDFPTVGAYAIALGLLSLLLGAQSAILSVFLPAGVALHAQGERERLGELLLNTTRWNLLGFGGILAIYGFLGHTFMNMYVGPSYAAQVSTILSILLLGQVTRLSMSPFSILAISAGDHRRITLSPMVEGFASVGMSILLGLQFGAVGVAWGTFIGSLVGVGLHLSISLPRSHHLGVSLSVFAKGAFVPSFLVVLPWLVLLIQDGCGSLSLMWPRWLLLSVSAGISGSALWWLFLWKNKGKQLMPVNQKWH